MRALRFAALAALLGMLAAAAWAGLHEPPAAALQRMARDPWFAAVILESRSGALAFWLWIAHKEGCGRTRFVWLVAILLFGNATAALYLLVQLAKLPPGAAMDDLLLSAAACARPDMERR